MSTIRQRSRGGISAVSTLQEWAYHTTCSDTSWHTNGSPITARGGTYEDMIDTVVDNFAKRRAKGELFFNSMHWQRHQWLSSGTGFYITSAANICTSPPNVWKSEYEGKGNWSYQFLQKQVFLGVEVPRAHFIVDQGTVRDLESEVSTEMLSQRGRADSNLYESLAEIDKTIGLFDKPISRLTQTFNKAAQAKREGKFRGYTVDGISHLWLAYRYGIVPLINDIQGITDGLTKKTELRRETTRAKKGFETSKSISYQSSFGVVRATVDCNITESYTVRAMSLDEFSTSLWENIGFTPKGLATVPWELVRYSFVADWFLNIGDFLGAITPAFGWKNLGSCLVRIQGVTNRNVIHSAISTNPSYVLISGPSGVADFNMLKKTRSPVRFPDLVIKNDFRFDKPKRVADALALLAQRGNYLFS